MALVVEMFAGALTGGMTVARGEKIPTTIINNMLSILIAPDRIGTAPRYLAELESMIRWVQTPAPGASPTVLLPGDPERQTRAERLRNGIPVDPASWAQIVAAAVELGHAKLPTMYRVHDEPEPERVENLRNFLATLGHKLAAGRGIEDGEEVLDIVARHPSTGHRLELILDDLEGLEAVR